MCQLQVSTKTSVLVTHQMLFMLSKWREVWGRLLLCRGGGFTLLTSTVWTFSLCWGCGSREIQSDQKNYR